MNLEQAMAGISIGEPQVFGGLAVFPLIGKEKGERHYLTLNEAFQKKGIEISEVSEGGSVPELRLKNCLNKDVFAADGETLLGAKQNRVLNSSIYVNAKTEIVIPVSCVEQGRWRYRRRNFQASEYNEFLSSRAAKMESVASSLKATGTDRYSDQGAVWEAMSAKRTYFQADAPTSSMHDVYDAGRESLEEYLKEFRPQCNQIGLACAIDGNTVGIEIFEDPGVFDQFFQKLVRAYAAEVVFEHKIATVVPDKNALHDLLHRMAKFQWDEYPAVGSGREFRTRIGQLNGSALEVEGRFLHMVVLRDQGRMRH